MSDSSGTRPPGSFVSAADTRGRWPRNEKSPRPMAVPVAAAVLRNLRRVGMNKVWPEKRLSARRGAAAVRLQTLDFRLHQSSKLAFIRPRIPTQFSYYPLLPSLAP